MTYGLLTNQGERDHNEDFIGRALRGNRAVFILADGLGGHGKGEVASRSVVENVISHYKEGEQVPELSECIEFAQQKLLEQQITEHMTYGMKTTLVMLELDGKRMRWAHIGDSRAYHFRKRKVIARTLDHSVPQMLVATGQIKEKEIRFHEDRNRLLRVMGTEWSQPQYVVSDWKEMNEGDAFLLCSDGFWEWIQEKYMEKALKKAKTAQNWLDLMEERIRKNGTGKDMDNYSAIAVWHEKGD